MEDCKDSSWTTNVRFSFFSSEDSQSFINNDFTDSEAQKGNK